ncbi:MAG: hypothetical protein KJ954_02090, partial [Alphaproteobacteria bacterium]|nr:hypothetical protein [Alphaproteobacteria bacterium]
MLAQSLFVPAAPAVPLAGDAPAAPADGAFGRLVDQATRQAATDETRPQVLPGADRSPPPTKHAGPPRPEVLPGDVGPDANDDGLLHPEVLPRETRPGSGPSPDAKLTPSDGDPRPEVLPIDMGPQPTPRPEILPIGVGPAPEPRPEVLPVEVGPTPDVGAKSARPEVLP